MPKHFVFDILTQESPDGTLGSSLAGIIEGVPYSPSRVAEMGLFQTDSLPSTTVTLETDGLGIDLVANTARSSEKTFVDGTSPKLVHFDAAHLSKSAKITETEIRNIRAAGQLKFQTAKNALLRKVRKPLLDVRATKEFHRLGAIRNIILDSDGVTPIDNMYTRLGLTDPGITYLDFEAMAAMDGFPLRDKLGVIVDSIADNLGGIGFDSIYCFVTNDTMRKIAALPECEVAFQRQQDGAALRQNYGYGTVFNYGGVTFEVYRGKVGTVSFVGADELVFFPLGANNFWQMFAPSTRIVDPFTGEPIGEGELGQPEFYLPSADTTNGEWAAVEIQSNPITFNTRPLSTVVASTLADPNA